MPIPKNRGKRVKVRTIKKGGKTMVCDVMEKPGPKGGRTVCHKRKK